jgi:hypothetical protein
MLSTGYRAEHTAGRAFREQYDSLAPERSNRIVETEANLADAIERYSKFVRERPDKQLDYAGGLQNYIRANMEAHAQQVRPHGRSGNLGGKRLIEDLSKKAAIALVASMARGGRLRIPAADQAFEDWHRNGCGGYPPPAGETNDR